MLFSLFFIFHLSLSIAQSDDVELTDSTSTEWSDGTGGGLTPQEPNDPVTTLTISQTSLTLEGGETVRLVATVNQRAKNKKIVWTSANEKVALVDAVGRVMGLSVGTTTVTATAAGNTDLKKTCSVTVTSDYVPPVSGYIIPWGKDEPWTVRYQPVEYSTDPGNTSWTLPSFNDSSWPTLTGPMGNKGEYNYKWEGDRNGFNLRYSFNMPIVDPNTIYTFYANHDNDLWIYLNGQFVTHFENWSNNEARPVTIPAEMFVKGKNCLALRIMENTGDQYLDFALYQKSVRQATPAVLPNVNFEFYYNAKDYDETDQSIPNQPNASLKGASLQLTANLPEMVNGERLHLSKRCAGFIDCWANGSTESGAYFYRNGQDCMTIVAKVAPILGRDNASDFIANRGNGYNYMWRIGAQSTMFLHTGTGYRDDRALPLSSEEPQIMAVRVDGVNDYILLQNLTTGDSKRVDGVKWGGSNNVLKLFYNNDSEYFLGDFYWVYYSFELLTDKQLDAVAHHEEVITGTKHLHDGLLSDGRLYDLQGRLVKTSPRKGIYISNHRKYVK